MGRCALGENRGMSSHEVDRGHGCGCHRGPVEPAQGGEGPRGRLTRRGVLRGVLAGAATGAAGTGLGLGRPASALAQSTLSPEGALQALLDGNRRFIERGMTSFQEDLQMLQQQTAEKQEPFASILSCADSRVPVELIFDQSIGHVFVNRIAGNIATSEIIASIEYGAAVLGTRVIMVLGHGNCGAVKASIEVKAVPGQISSLYRYIRPAVDEAKGDLAAAIEANARIQARLLRESSPVVKGLVAEGKLAVVPAVYDIASGKVTVLG